TGRGSRSSTGRKRKLIGEASGGIHFRRALECGDSSPLCRRRKQEKKMASRRTFCLDPASRECSAQSRGLLEKVDAAMICSKSRSKSEVLLGIGNASQSAVFAVYSLRC